MESTRIRRPLFILSYLIVVLLSFYGPRLLFLQPLLLIIGGLLFLYSICQMMRLHRLFPERHDKPSDFPELITWGPYSLCRHPFYFWTMINQLSIPLILGSLPGLVAWLATLPFWVILMKIEEKELVEYWGDKYREYMRKTPMLPTPDSIKRCLRRRDRNI